MFSFEQMALLHRHEDEWRELRESHHATSDDEDIERQLQHGGKLFRCSECDLEVVAVPPPAR